MRFHPRTHRTSLDLLFCCRRMAELVVVSMFGLIVTEQYVSPAIVNSYGAFNELRYLQAFERLLKLSVPTLWGWLVVFYTLFHLLLNITAEFTGFGDREFYLVRCSFCSPAVVLLFNVLFLGLLQLFLLAP